MALTQAERERLNDSKLKLQSVANSLKHVDPSKIPGVSAIEECLEDSDRTLRKALKGCD